LRADRRPTSPPAGHRILWAVYLVLGVAASGVSVLGPSALEDVLYPAIACSCVAAIALGIRLNRPAAALPWRLLAAGIGLFALADVVWFTLTGDAFPSIADALYLAAYPLLAVGLSLLVARRSGRPRIEGLIDGGIVAAAFAAAVWALVLDPMLDQSLAGPALAVSLAYPLSDIVVFAVAARLLVGAGKWSPSVQLLAGALGLLLLADVLYYAGLASAGAAYGGDLAFFLWPVSYALLGASALHGSMEGLRATPETAAPTLTRARLLMFVALTLVGPAVSIVHAGERTLEDVLVPTVLTALMAILVVARLAGMARFAERGRQRLADEGLQLRDELTIKERAATEMRALFEELVTTVPGAFFKVRLKDLVVLYMSPYVEQLLGFSPGELRSFEHFMTRVRRTDRKAVGQAFAQLQEGGREVQFEFSYLHRDGSSRWIGGSASVSPDQDGEIRTCTGYLFDQTARRAAMRMLEESERRFRELTENLDQVFFVMSADQRQMLYVSQAHTRITGYSTEGLYRDPRSWFDMVLDEDREPLLEIIRDNPAGYRAEFRIRAADGSIRWLSSSVRTIHDEHGIPYHLAGVVEDITERKLADEELRRSEAKVRLARDQAVRASHAKDEFLSRMSHELRTPLNSILGFAQLLEMDPLDAEQADGVGRILVAGRHLLSLINSVLDIARIESGRMSFSLEAVNLESVVTESVSLILLQAHERGLDVTWSLDGEVEVTADVQRLKQVLLNLLSNAVKYNAAGGSVEVVGSRREGSYRVEVTDHGPGIPEEKLERLFVPFDRLGADRSGIEGTGLGLALSRELVKAMGGELGVRSEVGSGTTFFFDLPLAEPAAGQAELAPTSEPLGAGATRAGARVLYVEDNESNLALMQKVLARRPGIVLETAPDGRSGLVAAARGAPDLILLDLHLPDMGGLDVLGRLDRTAPSGRRIPVVVVSADATPSQIERLRAAGADDYVTKPFRVDELLDVVDRWVLNAVR
jgi:PAS domain S-box-containing protein